MPLKVLIACEESQAVCIEFRKLGVEAYSCDLEPCSGGHPEYHLQMDIHLALEQKWDALIGFPPCTDLATSGNAHFCSFPDRRTEKKYKCTSRRPLAIGFFLSLYNQPIEYIALENPVGILSSAFRKPDQILHPWMFGEDASKKTCLWLKNLPLLEPTLVVPPKEYRQVRYAHDCVVCDLCEEPFCPGCNEHYADCSCPGPMQEDIYVYKTIQGFKFAVEKEKAVPPRWANQTPSGHDKLSNTPDRATIRSKTYTGIAEAMAKQWTPILKGRQDAT